jgi:hypothetical protein
MQNDPLCPSAVEEFLTKKNEAVCNWKQLFIHNTASGYLRETLLKSSLQYNRKKFYYVSVIRA